MSDMTPSFRRLWVAALVFLALLLGIAVFAAFSTENYFILAIAGNMVAIFAGLLSILSAQHIKTNKAKRVYAEGATDASG